MKSLRSFWLSLATAMIISCGGSGNTITGQGGILGSVPDAASIQLIASSPQLPSDQFGLTTVTITAIAKDANNNVISGIPIVFSADNNGTLIVDAAVPFTSSAGVATAELSNSVGDARNRTITVTATDGTVSATLSVDVIGTTLTVAGPAALAQNDSAPYTVILADFGGVGIFGENITVTSANGNAISPASTNLTTGPDGDAQFMLTATQPGNDVVTVTGLGLTATQAVSISSDSFSILTPAANQELILSAVPNTPVTAHWSDINGPRVGEMILFTSTRGTLDFPSAVTDGNGDATVMIGSTIAGLAQITAENSAGTTTAVAVEFVADTPATLTIQANPTTVAVSEQSNISVIVRDAQFNLVKNQVIDFLIVADDSFGQLSVGSAVTDSQGAATVFYTAGPVSGTPDGVTISATVRGTGVPGGERFSQSDRRAQRT